MAFAHAPFSRKKECFHCGRESSLRGGFTAEARSSMAVDATGAVVHMAALARRRTFPTASAMRVREYRSRQNGERNNADGCERFHGPSPGDA
ncbi:hypothetical protein MES4922_40348 [Mesorhizobium ventifaucium]|uniref:Uncharacterized protein n=1 Tax=Mesorhizobium ventifaucium TaxID=666020 RepID=A0ABN8K934_9HYPH|nr:hypothetical protein MES4922_40348 [Mesorhizobium ventifaucium]